jgi:hypothetical protein
LELAFVSVELGCSVLEQPVVMVQALLGLVGFFFVDPLLPEFFGQLGLWLIGRQLISL